MRTIILVICCHIIPHLTAFDIVFPVSENINWSPLNPDSIECFRQPDQEAITDGTAVKGYAPRLKEHYKVKGFLCTKDILSTTCSEGFFGGRELTYDREEAVIQERECWDQIKDWKLGKNIYQNYPPEACSWYRTSTTTNTVVSVREMDVPYDPYKNAQVSGLFLKGSCTSSFCMTTHVGVVWMADHDYPPECVSELLDQVVFYIKRHGEGITEIQFKRRNGYQDQISSDSYLRLNWGV